jgi:hypothetical protein
MIRFLLALLLMAPAAYAACTKMTYPTDFASVANGTRANLKANFTEIETRVEPCMDSVDEIRGRFSGYSGSLLMSSLQHLRLKLDSDASATGIFLVESGNGDSLFRVSEDSTARFFGPVDFDYTPTLTALTASLPVFTNASKELVSNAITGTGSVVMSASPTLTGTATFENTTTSGTATTTGVHTFTAAPVFSSATASLPMFTNGSKALVSNAMTGTGSVVMSASPTLTGTAVLENVSASGRMAVGSNAVSGIGSSQILSVSGASSTTQEVIRLQTGQSTGSAGDYMYILGRHRSSGGNNVDGATIRFTSENPETGTRDAKIGLYGSNNEVQTLGLEVASNGAVSMPVTATTTGVHTFTAAPVFSSVTASQLLLVDGSKALTSVAGTGSGSVVRATSPTITTPTFSGTIASGLTASRTVTTDGSGNFAVNTETGTGSHVRATSPTLVTPALGAATATTIVASGNITADSIVSSKFYEEGSFAVATFNCSDSPSGTMYWVRVGKQVTLTMQQLQCTSNATGAGVGTSGFDLPVGIRPPTTLDLPVTIVNNGSVEMGQMTITSTGALSTSRFNAAAFTASGNKGVWDVGISYTVQ